VQAECGCGYTDGKDQATQDEVEVFATLVQCEYTFSGIANLCLLAACM
jgi:hypothetical protein